MKIMNKVLVSLLGTISFTNMLQAFLLDNPPKFFITEVKNDTDQELLFFMGRNRSKAQIVPPQKTFQTKILLPVQDYRGSRDQSDTLFFEAGKGNIYTLLKLDAVFDQHIKDYPLQLKLDYDKASERLNKPLSQFKGKLESNKGATFDVHLRFIEDAQGNVIPAHKYLEVLKR